MPCVPTTSQISGIIRMLVGCVEISTPTCKQKSLTQTKFKTQKYNQKL